MSSDLIRHPQLIWATRGRTWGFRFLLDAGLDDPLSTYELAFARAMDQTTVCQRTGLLVAVRFPDPEGRRDAAGRLIPHEFVVVANNAHTITSVEDGIQQLWPLVARAYARIWDSDEPPSAQDVAFHLCD